MEKIIDRLEVCHAGAEFNVLAILEFERSEKPDGKPSSLFEKARQIGNEGCRISPRVFIPAHRILKIVVRLTEDQ